QNLRELSLEKSDASRAFLIVPPSASPSSGSTRQSPRVPFQSPQPRTIRILAPEADTVIQPSSPFVSGGLSTPVPRLCGRSPSRPPPCPRSSPTLLPPRRRPRRTSPCPSTSRLRSTPPGRRWPPRSRRRRTTPSTPCPKSSSELRWSEIRWWERIWTPLCGF
uniref:Uncharacterized protein n=1 Tax=Triticum urartu TaxID=4572 RepID=A0A8R7UHU7_TRIUA